MITAPKTLRLQYFNIEGPAEKSRLAFALARIPYVDDRVVFDNWPALKASTPYGQLPLLHIDDSKVLAQSDAILRYVGRLSDASERKLYPAALSMEVDEALSLVDDMNQSWAYALYIGMNPLKLGHECEKGSEEHKEKIKAMRERWIAEEFPRYASFLERRVAGGKFMVGDEVTIADCAVIPLLRRFCSGDLDYVDGGCVGKYPELKDYYDRFHAIPEVAAWYASRAK